MKKRSTGVWLVLILLALVAPGCTRQMMVRRWGSTMQEDLPAGRKLCVVMWDHEDHLWFLTRPARPEAVPVAYRLDEQSSFGVLQGHVLINETK